MPSYTPITLTQQVNDPSEFIEFDDNVVNYGASTYYAPENCGGPGYTWSYGIRTKEATPVAYDDSMTSSLVTAEFISALKMLTIDATSNSQADEYEIELRVAYNWVGAQVLTMTFDIEILFASDPACDTDVLTIDPTQAMIKHEPKRMGP